MRVHVHTATIEVEQTSSKLIAREIDSPGGPAAKIAAGLAGVVFVAGAAFFAVMPTDQPISETWWMRLILCGGLFLIGLGILWSTFSKSDSVTQIVLDGRARLLHHGKQSAASGFVAKGTVPFAAIKQFYPGSRSDHSLEMGGTTILYVEAEGGPRNGVLMVGSVEELEEFADQANAFLVQPADGGQPTLDGQPLPRTGFGRRV